MCVWACWFFSDEGGSTSQGHFQCLLLKKIVFWHCSFLIRSISSLECNQPGCGVVHLGYARSIFGCFVMTESFRKLKIVKGGKTPQVWVLSHLCCHCRRVHKCLASFHTHPCPLLHFSLLIQEECLSSMCNQWNSVASQRILLFRCHHSLICCGICLYHCDVERDCPQAVGDKPARDWATSHDSVPDVLVNKKSNALVVFILFSIGENLVFFLCCCFAKVLPSHFTESKDVLSIPVHFVC